MNNWIKYYYDIDIVDYYQLKNNYLLLDKYDNYYLLYFYDKDKININYIINILSKVNINNTLYYQIIYDRYNNIINNYENKEYILLKVKGLINDEINLNEIISNTYKVIVNDKIIDLQSLWSKKVDYLEYQISQLAKEKREVIDSFSYFIGLAENAISILNINNINYSNARLSLVHNRIFFPNKSIDYYNSLNLMIDYKVRDLAEYVKEKLYSNKDVSKDIDIILNNINNDEAIIFYARLMFPSTYFDAVENILLNNANENIIDNYIDMNKEYLYMLQETYYKINKKNHIVIPSWIIKVR